MGCADSRTSSYMYSYYPPLFCTVAMYLAFTVQLAQDDWWQLREPEVEARFVKDVYTDGTAIGA